MIGIPPFIVPSEGGAHRMKTSQLIGVQSLSKIVDKVGRTRVTSLFVIIEKDFVKITTYTSQPILELEWWKQFY